MVRRPPGVRIDTGGSGKGLAADLAADRLGGYATFVVDAGGDLRLGGERPLERLVRIDHPLDDEPAHEFMLDRGAVATSGIKTRLWRTEHGFAHHLLDPSTRRARLDRRDPGDLARRAPPWRPRRWPRWRSSSGPDGGARDPRRAAVA